MYCRFAILSLFCVIVFFQKINNKSKMSIFIVYLKFLYKTLVDGKLFKEKKSEVGILQLAPLTPNQIAKIMICCIIIDIIIEICRNGLE